MRRATSPIFITLRFKISSASNYHIIIIITILILLLKNDCRVSNVLGGLVTIIISRRGATQNKNESPLYHIDFLILLSVTQSQLRLSWLF